MKVILISNCAACPHYKIAPVSLRGACGVMEDKLMDAVLKDPEKYCPIPDWCPLTEVSLGATMVMKN